MNVKLSLEAEIGLLRLALPLQVAQLVLQHAEVPKVGGGGGHVLCFMFNIGGWMVAWVGGGRETVVGLLVAWGQTPEDVGG